MVTDNLRVLIVDDSAVIRTLLGDQLGSAPGLTVVGTARNGQEALTAIASKRPDVITLDVHMPGMDGLAVLDAILDNDPIPVVMVSALTRAGATVTLEALDRGAADYVTKPEQAAADKSMFVRELIHKIRNTAGMDMSRIMARRKQRTGAAAVLAPAKPIVKAAAAACPEELANCCIALGISTGGPPALARLFESLRPPMPPIVIVQHIPRLFTGPLAARLDALSAISVREAANGDALQPNCALIAPGGMHLELRNRGNKVCAVVRDGPPVSGHKPSVDVLMTSAAKVFGPNCLGVIMTGMGRDGVEGCRVIREAGGFVLGQDEASSDVYGMNRVAFVEGHVNQQFGLHEAAIIISRHVRKLGTAAAVL
jgi:two-component system, chemotaxis family, protein-glutamate methylesterase/glutaminase